MDTKSRKSTKLAKLIIAFCVILPAILLVSLYPFMETSMLEKRAYYEELKKQDEELNSSWVLADNLVNYAMETCYYSYAELSNSIETGSLDMAVFNEFGWNNDYVYMMDNSTFVVTYKPTSDVEEIVKSNADKIDDSICNLIIEFDSYGNLVRLDLSANQKLYNSDMDLYHLAMESVNQFKNNWSFYNDSTENPIAVEKYMPKNFILELGINDKSNFAGTYEEWFGGNHYNTSPEELYFETGAYGIIPVIYLFILIVAMTLPFVKSLNTGREKIFSMSFEVMLVMALVVIAGTVVMGYAMAYSTMDAAVEFANSQGGLMFVGTVIQPKTIYAALLGLNALGWSIVFFMVYALSANIRQLISDTKSYLNYQTLSIRFFRWLKKQIVRGYKAVTKVDLNDNVDKSILKIVGVNFVGLVFIMTISWSSVAVELIMLVVYSVAMFILIRSKVKKIQEQYHNILYATQQMADGNLEIKLEEDLGMFQSIGDSLEKVQQGFEKAVIEEAKSQNMKTELITNVSHDLKTPLTAIITYIDLLKKEDATEEEKRSYIKTLEQKSQRLKVLIEDLFEVSKAQSGNVTMNFMDVDVVSLMKQVKSEMSDQLNASSLDFRFNLPEEKIVLSLDGQRTYRVFENLISNTIKYSMPFSRVYVDVINEPAEAKVVFRNVSAQELNFDPERLTERFVRGDASRNSEGSGLGLAIAKSFVELQNGKFKIDVDGDLFKVTLLWKK